MMPPMSPMIIPSIRNGHLINQSVAPTNFTDTNLSTSGIYRQLDGIGDQEQGYQHKDDENHNTHGSDDFSKFQ